MSEQDSIQILTAGLWGSFLNIVSVIVLVLRLVLALQKRMEYRGRKRTDKLTIDQLLPQNVRALRVTLTMTAMAHLWVAPVPFDKNLRADRRRVRTIALGLTDHG